MGISEEEHPPFDPEKNDMGNTAKWVAIVSAVCFALMVFYGHRPAYWRCRARCSSFLPPPAEKTSEGQILPHGVGQNQRRSALIVAAL